MSKFFQWYKLKLQTNPLTTNTLTAGLTGVIGDFGAQHIEKYNNTKKPESERSKTPWSYNYKRTLKNFVFGVSFGGVPFYYWYKNLDSWFPKATIGHVLSKVFVNQLIWAPTMNVAYFTYVTTLLNYQNGFQDVLEKVTAKLKKEMIPTMVTSWKVWPLAQLINFYFLPPQYRSIYANAVGACWNMYLTLIGYKKN